MGAGENKLSLSSALAELGSVKTGLIVLICDKNIFIFYPVGFKTRHYTKNKSPRLPGSGEVIVLAVIVIIKSTPWFSTRMGHLRKFGTSYKLVVLL